MTEQNMFPEEPKGEPNTKSTVSDIYEMVESFVFVIAVMITLFCFVIRPATVFGQSMEPTLHERDWLVLQQIGYTPQIGDVVVIDRSQNGEEALVKRVIGKAGDVIYIDFEKHEVWRNDQKLDEPYINEPTEVQYDVEFPVTVPAGTVFVMGDNRNRSDDSRDSHIGMIDERRVMGKAIFRVLPLNKMGAV